VNQVNYVPSFHAPRSIEHERNKTMPLEVTFEIVDQKSYKEDVIAVFNDEEVKKFKAYLLHIQELSSTKIGREGMNPRLKVEWEQGKEMTFNADLPPVDDLLAYLLRLRPFLLQNEYASFESVCGILRRRINTTHFRGFIKTQMDFFKGHVITSTFQITVNNAILVNSEKTLMDWLNAYEYHRDQEKREKLQSVFNIMTDDGAKAIFVMLIVDKANAIKKIGCTLDMLMSNTPGNSVCIGVPNHRHDQT
jgi:hypothetical protein